MIGIVVALTSELKPLLSAVENLKEIKLADKKAFTCKICGLDAVIVVSSIGKVSAGLSTQLIIDKFSPDYILNFGTCGAVNDSVMALNYYAVDKCCQYDFDLRDLDGVPLGYIQEYDRVFFPTIVSGLKFLPKTALASADRFTHTEKDVASVNDIGCSLCDMEGGAIAQVCLSNNVPLVVIKGITDIFGSGTNQEQFFQNLKQVGEGFPAVIKKVVKQIKINKQ